MSEMPGIAVMGGLAVIAAGFRAIMIYMHRKPSVAECRQCSHDPSEDRCSQCRC